MPSPIYLDNNASTLPDPSVASVMHDELISFSGNPSSLHSFGREAKRKLSSARRSIAEYLLVKESEILFTSGGTEGMNFLIKGLVNSAEKPHILTSNIEHACVENTCKALEKSGCTVSYLPAETKGFLEETAIEKAIRSDTKLIVLSAVNGETGVKHDLEKIASLAKRYGIALVIDGVAWLGKEPIVIPDGITGIGFSGHKIHGPKGAGFVFLRSRTKISPLLHGGGQENGLRSGTENLPGILGLAQAVALLKTTLPEAQYSVEQLRDRFESELRLRFPSLIINGSGPRIGNVSNLAFPGFDAETLLIGLDMHGIAASHGSACSSGALEPSRILTAMGIPYSQARCSIRFSFSRYNTEEEVLRTVEVLSSLLRNGRS